ncbi:unnamed protein product [Cylindrotheca closterium]|uniref:CDP-diacylglycerol--glycerol-3-phosphate 3-phosphatidyltransferase n=1 Tax=Cylindrotheca closterium TaxID=2856 RepID=A0AAD2FKD7_9STRA|nr:unnamed protein product [Cylindrotheca closterium]
MKASQQLIRRCSLLDSARGSLQRQTTANSSLKRKYPLPAFPIKPHHVETRLLGATPSDFHETLCEAIRNAQERVYLASLYIGPGALVKYEQEHELLDALRSTKEDVDVKIILDQNRALREVPCDNGEMTSSAQAVADAIKLQDNHKLHLFQVLPTSLDALLPNPLNEVAGVFHIKAYIVDDSLILSGANLSEEYFTDRQDRYLCFSDGGNGLVDFYAKLIDSLCDNSVAYQQGTTNTNVKKIMSPASNTRLLSEINDLFCSEDPRTAEQLLTEDSDTIAVCMPTFHAPSGFWDEAPEYWTDIEATLSLLREGGSDDTTSRIHLSSAYLNPMPDLLKSVQHYPEANFVTAGPLSHGFRPKKQQSGNKGKAWIPTVFDHLIYEASKETHANMWHWERKDWTFHSKGIWIEEGEELLSHVVGSSNFGGRSFERDMESNLLMVFPPSKSSEVSISLQDEWGELMKHSKQVNTKEVLDSAPELPIHVKSVLPFIKSFF